MKTLIHNGTVITLGETNKVLNNHSILIENDRISKITPSDEITVEIKNETDHLIDAQGKLVLPGFINAHTHYYSSMARGLYKAAPSRNFQEVLNNLWWKLDRNLTLEDSYLSAMIANISAIKNGTTTLIDHHASPNAVKSSLAQIAKAVKETGLRANLCYEVSNRDGSKIALEGLEENIDFIEYCQKEQDPQLRALFGMHASFTIDQGTMNKAVSLADKYNHIGFHIHCAEDISDQIETIKMCNQRVIERLFDADILGEKTILAHGIHLNEHELNLITETKSTVVINPQSNMNNAVGVSNLLLMRDLNICVGLGTDAMTTNMLEELRSALWITKLHHKNPSVGFMETTGALIHGNRCIANRYWNDYGLGELKVGGMADIILYNYHTPTPLNEDSFLGHLLFGISQERVDTTIASGKILMQDGKLTTVNEEEIMGRALECSTQLWEKF